MFSALWDLFGSMVRALFDLGGAVLRVVFQLFSVVASAIFWPFRATWGLVSGNWGSLGPWTPAYLGVCVVVFLALVGHLPRGGGKRGRLGPGVWKKLGKNPGGPRLYGAGAFLFWAALISPRCLPACRGRRSP